MNIIQALIEALASLTTNKLRSALTILGIVIGVGAVIALVSIGRGAEASITEQINSIGTNLIYVMPGAQNVRNPRPLTLGDAQALANPTQAPSIRYVAPYIQGRGEVSIRGESITTSLLAVTPEYTLVQNMEASEGQLISQSFLKQRSAVAVLGSETALSLFGRQENLIGESIRIDGQPFRVIGVLKSKGGSSFGSQDDRVLIPLTTAQSRLVQRGSRDQIDAIIVQATQSETVSQAFDEMTAILSTRHHTPRNKPDFSMLNQQDILSIAQSITTTMTIFLGGIAAISLLVGGIGIMNIMLVSVTERTHEIGLRKALGARRRDILWQFLTESSVLSLMGGIIGILLGYALSLLIARVAQNSGATLSPSIGLDTILLATLFSTAVGLFFGLYPANRAARLQPVEALRYE